MKVKAFGKHVIPFLLTSTVSQFFYATSGDWVQEKIQFAITNLDTAYSGIAYWNVLKHLYQEDQVDSYIWENWTKELFVQVTVINKKLH